ncbi:unnamed protein product [Discosporangium mesarthrocarpum]
MPCEDFFAGGDVATSTFFCLFNHARREHDLTCQFSHDHLFTEFIVFFFPWCLTLFPDCLTSCLAWNHRTLLHKRLCNSSPNVSTSITQKHVQSVVKEVDYKRYKGYKRCKGYKKNIKDLKDTKDAKICRIQGSEKDQHKAPCRAVYQIPARC